MPVVIDAGGQKEIVEKGKCGFLWNSINELIEKTSKLMENEKLLKRCRKMQEEDQQDLQEIDFVKSLKKLLVNEKIFVSV